jgi:hypothetical protein
MLCQLSYPGIIVGFDDGGILATGGRSPDPVTTQAYAAQTTLPLLAAASFFAFLSWRFSLGFFAATLRALRPPLSLLAICASRLSSK